MLRHIVAIALALTGVVGRAGAVDSSNSTCAKVANLDRLKATTGAPWTMMPSIVSIDTDKVSCSYLSAATGNMLMVYARPDAEGHGEWQTRQALHRGNTEPAPGIGEEAFFLHDRGRLGLVARAKKTTYVLTGFPADREAAAKLQLTEIAKSLIASY